MPRLNLARAPSSLSSVHLVRVQGNENFRDISCASFIELIDYCGTSPGCVGVDFNEETKQCYLKSEIMTMDTSGAAANDLDSTSLQ